MIHSVTPWVRDKEFLNKFSFSEFAVSITCLYHLYRAVGKVGVGGQWGCSPLRVWQIYKPYFIREGVIYNHHIPHGFPELPADLL